MIDGSPAPVRIGASYVEWAPVAAGAIASLALLAVLLAAGSVVGLSLTSTHMNVALGKWTATLAVAFILVTTIGSFLVGGYLSGRLRLTWGEGIPEEVVFRDGAHGFLVWSLSIVIALVVLAASVTAPMLPGLHLVERSSAPPANSTGSATVVDAMLRHGNGALPAGWQPASAAVRDEAARIIGRAAQEAPLAEAERAYLSQIVSHQTGLASLEAQSRVDRAMTDAAHLREQSRKSSVLAGLVAATALLFGLAAAWYAAQRGGHHRDHNIPAKFGSQQRARVAVVAYSTERSTDGGRDGT